MASVAPEISVATDHGRQGWAVVSLAGTFDSDADAEQLGRLLCDLVVDHPVVSVDANGTDRLSRAACQVLVAAAEVFQSGGGVVVVSGPPRLDHLVLRVLDARGRLWVVPR